VRPWRHGITGLEVLPGNILSLPYEDASVPCIMALSVIEHIALSRYDSTLDPLGSVKACAELARVAARGGHLILAVPISHTSGVVYSAHRIFTRQQMLDYLPGFRVIEEVALYPNPGPPWMVQSLGEWSFAMWCVHLCKEE
jgi:SAM-dependent methyltransferase